MEYTIGYKSLQNTAFVKKNDENSAVCRSFSEKSREKQSSLVINYLL